jgi:hypothetical protein
VKQPWPYRLTNRPLRRRIKCGGCLTTYPDTRASVGQAEVTAVTSPLLFTVRYDRKTAPLALLRLPCQPPRATTDNRSRSTTELKPRAQQEASPRPTSDSGLGRRSPPRPTSDSGLGRRSPPRPTSDSASTPVSGGIASSPDPSLGHKRSLRLDRPWSRTDHADRGCIIPLLLACLGYKEQDWHPIWLTTAMGNDGAPRAPWRRWLSALYDNKETSAGSSPRCQLCSYRT